MKFFYIYRFTKQYQAIGNDLWSDEPSSQQYNLNQNVNANKNPFSQQINDVNLSTNDKMQLHDVLTINSIMPHDQHSNQKSIRESAKIFQDRRSDLHNKFKRENMNAANFINHKIDKRSGAFDGFNDGFIDDLYTNYNDGDENSLFEENSYEKQKETGNKKKRLNVF